MVIGADGRDEHGGDELRVSHGVGGREGREERVGGGGRVDEDGARVGGDVESDN
jgi:hypothetical protein